MKEKNLFTILHQPTTIEKHKSKRALRREKQTKEENLRVAQQKLEALTLEIRERQEEVASVARQLKAVGNKPKVVQTARDREGRTINLGDKILILTTGKYEVTTSTVTAIRAKTITFKSTSGNKDWRHHHNVKVLH